MMLFIIGLVAFLVGFCVSLVATGPVSLLVLKHTLLGRYRKCIPLILGSSTMEAIYCGLALTFVGAVFLQSIHVERYSHLISVIILAIIGLSLLILPIEKNYSAKIKSLSFTEKGKSFMFGVILIALNPAIILTWTAITTALLSSGFISLVRPLEMVFFTLFTGIGIFCGSLTMISLVALFKIKIPPKFFILLIRGLGTILLVIAFLYAFLF